ncbi:bcl-2-like protein 10 [Pipistrellus kuhlii]|uniref:BCL2 like 10 n=1 Tax=Pipistrellus kuhlii TaxID=59472 RepID=A0A7J7YKP6_PIPKU|nr:bcl-2-like protein 10 [Pipistrellus kuhlii]KAF6362563.1 BCL2 like 10 [Pipistrellus kuhlii]
MEEEDELRLRTLRLLTEFLEHCAQRPSTAPGPPPTPEAAVLRSLAARSWLGTPHSWSQQQRHRVEQVVDQAEWLVPEGAEPTWFSVLALVSFAGALLEKPPPGHARARREWEATVDRDCQRLAAFLCGWLTGKHRAWVEAQGGWDGFCHSFLPAPQAAWGRLLAPLLMSCLIHILLICLWIKSWLQDV